MVSIDIRPVTNDRPVGFGVDETCTTVKSTDINQRNNIILYVAIDIIENSRA
jgi:hypothetical protein